ncbi:hypothetical protein BGZ67_000885 [Mortierella alpina]|nr:hypothetical protein BGZ67_000885 [Mortierella alpina]
MVKTARRFSQEDENNMYSLPHFHAGQGHHPENTTTAMIPNSSHPHQASRQQDLPVAAATASHSKQGSTVGPNRRLAHILSEQKRREKINGGFDELKSVIPDCAENADSKAMILKKATAYILLLEDELKRYADICQQYPHLNTTLNHQDREGDQEH